MGGGIAFREVGLDFDDASGQTQLSDVPDQHLAEQFASNGPRVAGEESAIERTDRRMWIDEVDNAKSESECRE